MPVEVEESAEAEDEYSEEGAAAEATVLEKAEMAEAADQEEPEKAEGAGLEKEPAEAIAPAQIMPEPEQTSLQIEPEEETSDDANYSNAVADAGEKLEEIRRSYEEKNWMKMSEQLLSLGFIVNQLKVMQTIYT